jgi:hypothetical protein
MTASLSISCARFAVWGAVLFCFVVSGRYVGEIDCPLFDHLQCFHNSRLLSLNLALLPSMACI